MLSILHDIQAEYGYLNKEVLEYLSKKLNTPISEISRVATYFGKAFSMEPKKKHTIRICQGTTCHVKYSDNAQSEIQEELEKIKDENFGEHKNFSLEKARCLGCCASAPNIEVDGVILDKEAAKSTIIKLKGEK